MGGVYGFGEPGVAVVGVVGFVEESQVSGGIFAGDPGFCGVRVPRVYDHGDPSGFHSFVVAGRDVFGGVVGDFLIEGAEGECDWIFMISLI